MAKETRLDESAQIYQPRDNRTEKQKLHDMTFHEKLEHINAYYKYKIIAVVVVVIFIISVLHTVLTPKDATIFNAAIINQSLDSNKKSEFITDFGKYINISKKQNIVLDDSYFMSDKDTPITVSSAAREKLQTYVYANQIDVVIADESDFKAYANAEYFDNLADRLPTDLYSKLTDKLYFTNTEDDKSEKAYGIYLTDNQVIRDLGILAKKPVLGIVSNSKYKDNSISFLKYINNLK
ncbi:hypothetical protein [Anaeromicropila herbilytica]|uniref:Uncharacterized protein n=1 Tax=Anaeromicropila herbilytica TaxID=2785025 RepID=A0A7R7EIB3_9FIRM|nr:hypothetical protein [Anaeromicropila herbilytica]BCN29710.1 hypothetical protein bsdtb5_10050 [Anaeromicropila herbilytica]